MTADSWPEGMDPHGFYRTYTPDENEDRAAASFERRYGRPPEYVAVVEGLLRVGPVPEGINGHTDQKPQ